MKCKLHKRPSAGVGTSWSPRSRARFERGVALVITLILLAVITFMAVTFLVVSRSQRGAVANTTDLTIAREGANAAQDRALAEILASIVASTNPGDYSLLVSTNYISPVGFRTGVDSYTNVSYVYPNGTPVTGNDALQNISQLLFNPRVPVFITNRLAANSMDFRYYVDWNRNGRYDTNGFLPVMTSSNLFLGTNYTEIPAPLAGQTVSNFFLGDPEFIGALERADLPHSSSNRFVYRYAYLVLPAGKSLDVNYVHNYSRGFDATLSPGGGDGFTRNQGVGTFEINLAAFLTDLNTNLWPYPNGNIFGTPYYYDVSDPLNLSLPNRGAAFDDALSIVRHRYAANRLSLPTFSASFGNNQDAKGAFTRDWFDGYARGPLMTNTAWVVNSDLDLSRVDTMPWPGSENTNHFFTPQDFFDVNKTSLQFSNRLWTAGTNNDSYSRYTFYRLLSQMGTGSSWEEPADKINLNYDNKVQGTNVGRALDGTQYLVKSATNFISWRPLDFFTNTANKLIENAGYRTQPLNAADTNFLNVNHIQIHPINYYTPSVHQLLQLAANIYDATTNQTAAPSPPSVFRPLFTTLPGSGGTNQVYISGFEEVTNLNQMIGLNWRDLSVPSTTVQQGDMVYGVPLVVGAKKGFPNFNEFAMQTTLGIARKMEFRREGANNQGKINETNQLYTLTISNSFGLEAWNSYTNAFPRSLEVRSTVEVFCTLTNEFGNVLLAYSNSLSPLSSTITNFQGSTWYGFTDPNYAQASFRLPLPPRTEVITNAVYRDSTRSFYPLSVTNNLVGTVFERHPNNPSFPLPRWFLNLRTRVRFILVDTGLAPARIVDYVNLDSVEPPLDIAAVLPWGSNCTDPGAPYVPDGQEGSMWCTNRWQGGPTNIASPTFGMLNQIAIGLGMVAPTDWNSFVPMYPDRDRAIDFFRAQFDGFGSQSYPTAVFTKTNVFYAPYVPVRRVHYTTEWQANDPLVHYTIGDLVELWANSQTNRIRFEDTFSTNNLGRINRRYEPWEGGGNPLLRTASDTVTNLAVKDPLVVRSDHWDFPTNKFPNVGWLGRVHRGTPWQTINLKSAMLPFDKQQDWQKWSGNGIFVRNDGQLRTNVVPYGFITNDAAFTHPINDRYILDLFTASVNDNATRGQMAVNQTNLAAWSALLSGVNVLQNTRTNLFVEPAGTYDPTLPPPVVQIVQGIQRTMTNYPGGTFRRLGDLLAVPELTVKSPFIKSASRFMVRDLTDAVYERIPQQILGLLKGAGEPRFVIYSFGQALKPADRSLVTSGPYFGLCTNYQITAEVATRTVIRIEGAPDYPSPFAVQPPLTELRAVVESFNILPPE